MIEQELGQLKQEQENLLQEIRLLLLPKDQWTKNVVMEIRSGAGGERSRPLWRSIISCVQPFCRKKWLENRCNELQLY